MIETEDECKESSKVKETTLVSLKQIKLDRDQIIRMQTDDLAKYVAAYLINFEDARFEAFDLLQKQLQISFHKKYVFSSSFVKFALNENDDEFPFTVVVEVIRDNFTGNAEEGLTRRLKSLFRRLGDKNS